MVDGIFLITGYAATSPAQEFLQIEVQNDPDHQIWPGSKNCYQDKTKRWIAKPSFLRKIIYETGTILYDQGMLQVEDIALAIRETRPGVGALSVALTTFGGELGWLMGWSVKGLDNKAEFGNKEIVIGLAAGYFWGGGQKSIL